MLIQLAAMLAAGRFTAGAWATRERSSAERAARSAGLPLTPAEFEAKYPRPAEADDLADALVMTAGEMHPRAPAWTAWETASEPGRPLRQDGELPPDDRIGVYRKAVRSQRDALSFLDKFDRRLDPLTGGDAAADWPYLQPDGTVTLVARWFPWLGHQRDLANLLRLAAVVRVADGDPAGALRAARLQMGQSDALADGNFLVITLVSVGVQASAMDAMDDLAANLRPGQIGGGPRQVSREELRGTIALLLDDGPIRRSLARGLAGEILMSLDAMDHSFDADSFLKGLARDAGGGPYAAAQRRFAARSLAWLLRPLVDREAATFLRLMTQAAEADGVADAPQWLARAPGDAEEDAITDRFAPLPLAKYLYPSVNRAGLAHFWVIADRHRVAAALAARLYQADHGGELPPTLAALVPAYLPSVPRDATAADAVVGYDPARRRLWTAGRDGDDDNGVSEADLLRDDPTQSNRDLRGRFDDVLVLR